MAKVTYLFLFSYLCLFVVSTLKIEIFYYLMHSAITSYRMLYFFIALLLLLLFLFELIFGSVAFSLSQVYHAIIHPLEADAATKILWSFRLPRACTALLAGAALSVCGVQMQTLFRNPLADPYILGISSGAGFGVAIFVMGFSAGTFSTGVPLLMNLGIASAAWMGALVVSALVMAASKRLSSTGSLLILGIMIGSVGSAFISMLQYISSASSLKMYVLWTFGSFSGVMGTSLLIMGILVILGIGLSIFNIKDLNALNMGETYSKSLGVNINGVKNRIFISTALLAGSVTAFCGPIGFVGIAVPHLARMFFKNANHKTLIPSAALLGACVMLFADLVSQLPGSHKVLPINTVAAMLGIPVVILIILQNRS